MEHSGLYVMAGESFCKDSMQGPTHHGVIGGGLHIDKIKYVAKAMGVELRIVSKL